MRRKFFIVLTFIIVFFVALVIPLFFTYDFPIVFEDEQLEMVNINSSEQFTFNPLENIDFASGNNIAYLLFERTDINELPKAMSRNKLFECSDNEILQNLKRDFIFRKSGGDMATCESEILIYKEEKLVLRSAIVLTDSLVGLQNSKFGWADAQKRESLKNSFIRFKPTYKLFVKL
jgi:hypothetical protein